MKKILTIIVPSYNTEKYVDECLPTMLSEELLEDIEILMINDGSRDNTPSVIQPYAEKYPQTIRLINKENGGHGSVLNRGIREAAGTFVKVVDGDDWVDTKGLISLVAYLKTTNADMVLNPLYWYHVQNKNMQLIDVPLKSYRKEYDFKEVAEQIKIVQIHSVTYRTELLRDNGISFQENCFYEDQEYDIYPMLYVEKVVCLNEPVYIYRIGEATQSISVENVIRNRAMSEQIIKNLLQFYNQLPKDVAIWRKAYLARTISRIANNHSSLYLKMKFGKEAKAGLKHYFEMVKNISEEIYYFQETIALKLMKRDSWLFYSLAYITFKVKRILRGF